MSAHCCTRQYIGEEAACVLWPFRLLTSFAAVTHRENENASVRKLVYEMTPRTNLALRSESDAAFSCGGLACVRNFARSSSRNRDNKVCPCTAQAEESGQQRQTDLSSEF